MTYRRGIWLGGLLLATLGAPLHAALGSPHFVNCASNTGVSATVIFPEWGLIDLDGSAIEAGDEVAVFSTDGICAGAGIWTGESIAIALWGDNEVTPQKDGLLTGEPLYFRVWDSSEEVEYGSARLPGEAMYSEAQRHYELSGVFKENGIYVVEQLRFARTAEHDDAGKAVGAEEWLPREQLVTLGANYPNPFNPSTTISYTLDAPMQVRLSVLNVLGQTVRVLHEGHQSAGTHAVLAHLDGLPSGMYLYRVDTPTLTVTRTMLLSK